MWKKIKNFLKRFFPVPARTHNAQIDAILSQIESSNKQNSILETQIKFISDQNKLFEDQISLLTKKDQAIEDEVLNTSKQVLEILNISKQALETLDTSTKQTLKTLNKTKETIVTLNNRTKSQITDAKVSVLRVATTTKDSVLKMENNYLKTLPQPRLSYFVLNILDHCNLRCKGCDHFACLAEERFVPLFNIKNDLKRMSVITEQEVTRIGIMGGEPLLHPDLQKILTASRKAFPNTLLQLVSNGILMLKQDVTFWRTCHNNNINIVITKYPIAVDYTKIEQVAKENDVSLEYYGSTGEITKTLYKMPMDIHGTQDSKKSFWNCYHANTCPILMEGKMYPCTILPNIVHFNKKFDLSLETEKKDYLDIYKVESQDDLLQFLSTPKPFCRYCRTTERSFGHKWELSKQAIDEWV